MFATIHEKRLNERLGPAAALASHSTAGASATSVLARLVAALATFASNCRRRMAPAAFALISLCGLVSTACRVGSASPQLSTASTPTRTGLVLRAAVQVDGRERRFEYYVPARPAPQPPIVLAFHGSGGSGARLRGFMGGELERLAEQRGFIAVYPEGFEGNWNGCRAPAPSSANRLGIDDIGFVQALVAWLERELGADPLRVYAVGFSGGGHMAYRLALEVPERITAIAVIGASLPAEDDLDCQPSGNPVSVMIVNGRADPVNPYDGGVVVAPAGTPLGRVRSTRASAEYFARISGYAAEPTTSLMLAPRQGGGGGGGGGTGVERATWSGAARTEVVLVTIEGGGHTIPGPRSQLPDFVGATERRFLAVEEAVSFLLRQWSGRQAEAAMSPSLLGAVTRVGSSVSFRSVDFAASRST